MSRVRISSPAPIIVSTGLSEPVLFFVSINRTTRGGTNYLRTLSAAAFHALKTPGLRMCLLY
jgi:hypothetical protein